MRPESDTRLESHRSFRRTRGTPQAVTMRPNQAQGEGRDWLRTTILTDIRVEGFVRSRGVRNGATTEKMLRVWRCFGLVQQLLWLGGASLSASGRGSSDETRLMTKMLGVFILSEPWSPDLPHC